MVKTPPVEPKGLGHLEAEELITAAKLMGLASLLERSMSPDQVVLDQMVLKKHVRWVAGTVNEGLRYAHRRPRSEERKHRLTVLKNRTKKLKEALESLDPWTLMSLTDAASLEFGWPGGPDQPETRFETPGEERFLHWLFHLIDLEHALAKAAEIPGKPGRPPFEAIAWGTAALREVWAYHTGSKPTLSYSPKEGTTGDFLTFCREIIAPISQAWGITSDLERAVKDAHMDKNLGKFERDRIHNVISALAIPN